MSAFGSDLGVGLQMLDDYSAIVSVRRREKAREDLENGRPTWPWAWIASSLDVASFERFMGLLREVQQGAASFESLRALLADAIRETGAAAIRKQLTQAVAHVRPHVQEETVLAEIEGAIAELEKRYA